MRFFQGIAQTTPNRGTLTRHNLIPHVVALTALDAPGTITAGDSDPKDPETYLTVWSSLSPTGAVTDPPRDHIGCGSQNGTRPIYDTYFEVKKLSRCWADIHPTDGAALGSFSVRAIGCEVGKKTRITRAAKPDGAFVFTQ